MLVAVSGTKYSGIELAIEILVEQFGFELLSYAQDADELLDYATRHYTKNMTVRCEKLSLLETLEKRPFFVHVSLDAPVGTRYKLSSEKRSLEEFIRALDAHDFTDQSVVMRERSHVKLKVMDGDVETIRARLADALGSQLQALSSSSMSDEVIPPLRPDWDSYFMKLATLAASRSNCMKRKVGCVIVRDRRVIATGYNGTPRHLKNCFNGGCPRCNGGDSHALHTCLCLHAEENALLEAGRDRVGTNAILYCDTCPCLTCSVKIVQTGITEVVYSQTYRMDEASFQVLRDAGVKVRQFSFILEPRIMMV
ncbi:hypothetical protein HG536_0G04320 [Torulaspora globosa]|uniref:Deoxycytidylate deaminase n=1 Tax=Torulaspora globosa TaxID=48254 RepID=A0A7G3ZM34_9SACH|nr:uncharacterized protein HG536_0G04320 [Torulaspora globosa]QLL34570.1 hypothetical protein HG536_0G04320 [Torulaspora globosa]